jgi:hypothetical protein
MGQVASGSISMWDQNNVYSRILRPGASFTLAWGYKQNNFIETIADASFETLDLLSDPLERRGLKVFVTSPSGTAGGAGKIMFNCSFLSIDMRGQQEIKLYESGTKKDVIQDVMARMGIYRAEIDFERGSEVINSNTAVMQWETDFQFLSRLSWEWRTYFFTGYDRQGRLIAFFIDPSRIKGSSIVLEQVNKRSNLFEYGTQDSNVLSYTWQDKSMDSGIGSNGQLMIIDGVPVVRRYVMEQEAVVTYRLNTEMLDGEIKARYEEDGAEGAYAFLTDALAVDSFDQIERYFTPIEQETAPDGTGIELNIQTLGNVAYVIGGLVDFGFGFPDRVGNRQVDWYLRKVGHTVSQAGYRCSCNVVDTYTLSPTGMRA